MVTLEILSRIALGLSLFITFLLLWLGMTTLLAVRRDQVFGRMAGIGLLLASAFFLSHAMIVGKGPTTTGSGMEFWWRLGWVPAVSAPLTWYATVIRYAGLPESQRRVHQRLWWGFLVVGFVVLVLLVIDNPFAEYRALLVSGQVAAEGRAAPVVWLYLALNVAGFGLPVLALLSGGSDPGAHPGRGARPWLIGTGLALLGVAILVAVTAAWAVGRALPLLQQQPGVVDRLMMADIAALVLVSIGAVLLGRAVVAYEVFTERPLPRQGFFRRWRSVVLTAFGGAALVPGLLAIGARPLYSLTALTLLGLAGYALFTWQSYRAHERFIARLLPFVTSLGLSDQLLRSGPTQAFDRQAADLLRALCEDALGTDAAEIVLQGEPPRRASYQSGPSAAAEVSPKTGLQIELVTAQGTTGSLILSPKRDGRGYVTEEVELARACGERLLDVMAGAQIAQLLKDLLRQRLGELQVIGTRHKRVLHDEVLPDIHTALLSMESQGEAADPETRRALARVHRTIAELLQAGPPAASGQLAQRGLLDALRETVEHEFAESFAQVSFEVDTGLRARLEEVELGVAEEVVYFAACEAVRNAARHAAGGPGGQPVKLEIRVAWSDGLQIEVADDGVGMDAALPRRGGGAGLLFHSTMMAVVGGQLGVGRPTAGGGTVVRLFLPAGGGQGVG